MVMPKVAGNVSIVNDVKYLVFEKTGLYMGRGFSSLSYPEKYFGFAWRYRGVVVNTTSNSSIAEIAIFVRIGRHYLAYQAVADQPIISQVLLNDLGHLCPVLHNLVKADLKIASEKYEEFRALEELVLSVAISTGDYDQPAEYLGGYNIIVATCERFGNILRLKPTWLSRVGVLVIDELHNIGDPERGPIIEMIAARALRRGIRVVGLTATIGNPHELSSWLNAVLVYSTWRPVKLIEAVYSHDDLAVIFQDGRVERVREKYDEHVLNLVLHNLDMNMQMLVFIHNRKKVEEYAQILASHLNLAPLSKIRDLIGELEEAPTSYERAFSRSNV